MQRTISNMEFVQGISTKDKDSRYPSLYIFDDLMKDATKDENICELYMEGSHHRNLSVICLLQNLYNKGKENRTSQYLVLFKNPLDQQQLSVLARQMYPNKSHQFLEKFREATYKPYGYLLIDLKQETPESVRLRTNVIKGSHTVTTPQYVTSIQSDNISKMDTNQMYKVNPSCMDCGLLFVSPMDLQKHMKRGCPEDEEPPTKRFKHDDNEDEDESGWEDLIIKAYDEHDDVYQDKVNQYENEGFSNREAERKASEDLHSKYRKSLMNIYKEYMLHMHGLENSETHNIIMKDIDYLMDEKFYDFDEALKLALRKHRHMFDELVADDEDSGESDDESSGVDDLSESEEGD